jgi:hypothetical protein
MMPAKIDVQAMTEHAKTFGQTVSALDANTFEWGAAMSANGSSKAIRAGGKPAKGSTEAKAMMANVRAAKGAQSEASNE